MGLCDINKKTGIQLKLFVGLSLSPDLRHHLYKSAAWKISRVALSDTDLIELSVDAKNYVGIYLEDEKTTLKTLQQLEKQLKETLHHYLPDIPTHDLPIEVFSKLFVL